MEWKDRCRKWEGGSGREGGRGEQEEGDVEREWEVGREEGDERGK